jgi:transcriptional regulator with XRE-family HTH domain
MELSIGKNIQNKRKALGMTQELVADALGVSIAAVSKWETGSAYPDITLLSPLARLLGSTVDDLLGFEPQLSQEQLKEITDQCVKLFESSAYQDAVACSEQYLKEYPNSMELKLRIGSIFMMHISSTGSEDAAAKLLERAETLMREAAKSDNIQLQETAWQGLSALLMQQERYEDSLNALEQIHKPLSDPDTMKVSVYYAMNDLGKSKQTAQQLLFSHSSACDIALISLAKIARKEKNYPLAVQIINLSLQLSQMFDRNQLYGQDLNHHLLRAEYAAEQKQVRETLAALQEFVRCAKIPYDFEGVKASPFFDALKMHTPSTSKGYLNRCAYQIVKENEAFTFLKDNGEFLNILKELEQLPE